jgi:aerobic carbon-monoxide dehydrogenase medium subunit
MYPPRFNYYRAASVDEALALLQEHQGAKLLAGGHSLLPLMKMRLSDPGTLIDIGRIGELRGISTDNDSVRIGALTPHVALETSRVLPKALVEAAGLIGDPQVRNRGTVGGNIAHADPASDLPTVLLALNATIQITGPRSTGNGSGHGGRTTQTIAAEDFFTGFFATALEDDEILIAVDVPLEQEGTGSAYAKLINPASRYAMVGAAAVVTLAGGVCTYASVAVGGLTPNATKAPSVEAALTGSALSDEVIEAAAAAVDNDLGEQILGDIHASADYRRSMAPVLVARALRDAVRRAG